MKKALITTLALALTLPSIADEGMWMLTDLQKQNEVAMTELGLLIPANQIYNPDGIALKDAVIHFGGGCTHLCRRIDIDQPPLWLWCYPTTQYGGTRLSDGWFLGHEP